MTQTPRWSLLTREGLTIVQADVLGAVPGIAHGFSTRQDGANTFDLGPASAEGEPWSARRRRLASACGLGERALLAPRQVHGDAVVGPRAFADGPPAADAVVLEIGSAGDRAAAVRTADCLPVLIASRDGRTVAAIHAGWRGTAAGIVVRAVARLGALGGAPGDLVAALGPAIGVCCYEVGDEVVVAVAEAAGAAPEEVSRPGSGRRRHLDLAAANRRLLERCGVPAASIEAAPWCTRCRGDLFWSYRREGAEAGRMMACIGRNDGSSRGAP